MPKEPRPSRFQWSPQEEPEISQCVYCAHTHEGDTCDAFPNGIPQEILTNDFDHRQPYEGDGGVQFEAKEGRRHPLG